MKVIRRQVMNVVLVDNVWTFGIDLGLFIELNEFSLMTKIITGDALILVSTRRLRGVMIE